MNCDDNYKKALQKIKCDEKCKPKVCQGPMGPTGATGPQGLQGSTGPTGPAGESACCACVKQMTNIIKQIIELYPDKIINPTFQSGNATYGYATGLELGPNGDTGTFLVTSRFQPSVIEHLPICKIDSITINMATYNDAITYLQAPASLSPGCCTDCDETIRRDFPVGTENIDIFTNTRAVLQGTVIKNEYGMIVLENQANNYITFISSCRIEVARSNKS